MEKRLLGRALALGSVETTGGVFFFVGLFKWRVAPEVFQVNFSILGRVGLLSLTAALSVACAGGSLDDGMDAGSGGDTSAGGGTSTGGSASGGGSSVAGCDPTPVLASCAGVTCHGSPGSPARFYSDLFNPAEGMTLGQTLMTTPVDYAGEPGCPTTPEPIINQAAPSESMLMQKVHGSPACGDPMPSGAAALTADEVACLNEWVMSVAANGM